MKKLTTIATAVSASPPRIAVLHGSHSGNTERLAKELHSELKWRLGLNVYISSFSKLCFDDLDKLRKNDLLLMLLSTYGEGGPNPATQMFWDSIFSKPELKKSLKPFSYSVLSRGSSLYDATFALAGMKIDAQLSALGAKPFAPCGIQDKTDQHSYDQFFQWKESIIHKIVERDNITEKPFAYTPSTIVKKLSSVETSRAEPIIPNLKTGAKFVNIKAQNLESTDRHYVYAKLELPGYFTGSHATIWPSNCDQSVLKFLEAYFGKNAKELAKTPLEIIWEGSRKITTYELLAKHTVYINGRPERELLLKLISLAPSDEAANLLKRAIHTRLYGSLVDIMLETSPDIPWSTHMPPSAFFDILPTLQPRCYSISTSSKLSPNWAGVSAVVECDPQHHFMGVASGQLYRLANTPSGEGQIMALHEPLKSFMLPDDPEVPLILVSVGTGVAPFRGFLQERSQQNNSGPIMLFTGTRTREDLIHHNEIQEIILKCANQNIKHIPAYSRVSKDDLNYGYFASDIKKNADEVFKMIESGAHIYVCGDIRKVRRGVRNTVAEIMATQLDLTHKEGQNQWKRLKTEGRLHIELW